MVHRWTTNLRLNSAKKYKEKFYKPPVNSATSTMDDSTVNPLDYSLYSKFIIQSILAPSQKKK